MHNIEIKLKSTFVKFCFTRLNLGCLYFQRESIFDVLQEAK